MPHMQHIIAQRVVRITYDATNKSASYISLNYAQMPSIRIRKYLYSGLARQLLHDFLPPLIPNRLKDARRSQLGGL